MRIAVTARQRLRTEAERRLYDRLSLFLFALRGVALLSTNLVPFYDHTLGVSLSGPQEILQTTRKRK